MRLLGPNQALMQLTTLAVHGDRTALQIIEDFTRHANAYLVYLVENATAAENRPA